MEVEGTDGEGSFGRGGDAYRGIRDDIAVRQKGLAFEAIDHFDGELGITERREGENLGVSAAIVEEVPRVGIGDANLVGSFRQIGVV